MKTFIQWAEKNKKELPVYNQQVENATKRGGIAHWAYPNLYARNSLPPLGFAPIAADFQFKLGKETKNQKAPPDNAP